MYAGLRSEPLPVTQQVGGPSLLLEVQVTGETLVSPSVGANPLLLQVMVNVQGAESLLVIQSPSAGSSSLIYYY